MRALEISWHDRTDEDVDVVEDVDDPGAVVEIRQRAVTEPLRLVVEHEHRGTGCGEVDSVSADLDRLVRIEAVQDVNHDPTSNHCVFTVSEPFKDLTQDDRSWVARGLAHACMDASTLTGTCSTTTHRVQLLLTVVDASGTVYFERDFDADIGPDRRCMWPTATPAGGGHEGRTHPSLLGGI